MTEKAPASTFLGVPTRVQQAAGRGGRSCAPGTALAGREIIAGMALSGSMAGPRGQTGRYVASRRRV